MDAGETCFFHPTGTDATVNAGLVYSIGASTFPGGYIEVSATDANSARGLTYEPAIIPTRPGVATLLGLGSVDDEGGKHIVDVWCSCSRPLPVSCE